MTEERSNGIQHELCGRCRSWHKKRVITPEPLDHDLTHVRSGCCEASDKVPLSRRSTHRSWILSWDTVFGISSTSLCSGSGALSPLLNAARCRLAVRGTSTSFLGN